MENNTMNNEVITKEMEATIEEVGKRRFYCSAVNGKAPEVYIEVCVIGFPTSYTMPT